MEPRSIFVPFFWGIGNMVLFTPALAAMRRAWPGTRITVHTTRPGAAEIISQGPLADTVAVRPTSNTPGGKIAWLAEVLGRFDLVVSPLPLASRFASALMLAAGARRRCGFEPLAAGPPAGWLDRAARTDTATFDETRHEVLCNLDLVAPLGVQATSDRRLHVSIRPADREQAAAALRAAGLDGRALVAIHVGAHPDMRGKQWSADRFGALVDALVARQDLTPVIVGGPDDTQAVEAVLARAHARPASLAGKLSLKATAALFERCRAVVANDSGPMHLAAATATPVLGIFGPTNPWKNAPWTAPGRGAVIRLNIGCSPCYRVGGRILCAPQTCLEALDVARVIAALDGLMAQATAGRVAGTTGTRPATGATGNGGSTEASGVTGSAAMTDLPWGAADPSPAGAAMAPVGPPATIGTRPSVQ